MSAVESVNTVVERLRSEPNVRELSAYMAQAAQLALENGDIRFATGSRDSKASMLDPSFTIELADTPFGNPVLILRRGAQAEEERQLLGVLLALGMEPSLPSAPEIEQDLACRLVWLATYTPVDALSALDAALGAKAAALWHAIGNIAVDPARVGRGMTRAHALVALAALRNSSSEAAARALENVTDHATEPLVLSLVRGDPRGGEGLRGELFPPPRGPVVTALLTVTLVLFVLRAGRLIGRLAFAYRRPARLQLSSRGLELQVRTELLGKVLRDRSLLIPLANVARVTREVRYARAGLYAGLTALILGSYFGMGLLVDGLRVPGGSGALLALAALLMVIGLGVDFGLSSLPSRAARTCRVVITQRKGRALCIAALDAQRADAMLASVARATTR